VLAIAVIEREWVDSVFDAMEHEQPGRIFGLPEGSAYEGLDAEVAALLTRTDGGDTSTGRPPSADEKGRVGGEVMNVDRWRRPVQLRGDLLSYFVAPCSIVFLSPEAHGNRF
jgi:hypothetical protein